MSDKRQKNQLELAFTEEERSDPVSAEIHWKQWKRGKRRYAKLRQLGVGQALAAQTADSPHGPWHLAKSPALS